MKEYPRKLRLNPQLQRELATLIAEELTDPRLAGASVSEVDVSPDLRNATVRVTSLGSEAELEQSVRVLGHAAPRLRKALGARLRMRYVPQLHFRSDVRVREADRLTRLIRTAVDQDRSHARDRNGD